MAEKSINQFNSYCFFYDIGERERLQLLSNAFAPKAFLVFRKHEEPFTDGAFCMFFPLQFFERLTDLILICPNMRDAKIKQDQPL